VDEPSAARFNADPKRLFEASGCAGKVLVFAVRLDTFPKPERSAVFYIGTNDPAELTALRRGILSNRDMLPVSGEYIHRDAFDIAQGYGKDMVVAILLLGTRRLPHLFRLKAWVDRLAAAVPFFPARLSDRLLQRGSRLFPPHLPARLRGFRDAYEHHLILTVADDGIDFARRLLAESFPTGSGDAFECDAVEARQAMLHRFAVAGSAIRYQALHPDTVEGLVAIDVALRRDDREWFEQLPAQVEGALVGKLYYGHFFCHVFHQDYLVRKGADPVAVERAILAELERRGAEYPAEHNVGHLYRAKPELADHYRRLDPANCMNPGIGRTSRNRGYG
jgi:D-lactate dehydrogenase (quinone)